MKLLPHFEHAVIAIEKLENYVLISSVLENAGLVLALGMLAVQKNDYLSPPKNWLRFSKTAVLKPIQRAWHNPVRRTSNNQVMARALTSM